MLEQLLRVEIQFIMLRVAYIRVLVVADIMVVVERLRILKMAERVEVVVDTQIRL